MPITCDGRRTVWAPTLADSPRLWVASAKVTLLNHLITCGTVVPEVKAAARAEKEKGKGDSLDDDANYAADEEPPTAGPSGTLGLSTQSLPTAHRPSITPPILQPAGPQIQRSFSLPAISPIPLSFQQLPGATPPSGSPLSSQHPSPAATPTFVPTGFTTAPGIQRTSSRRSVPVTPLSSVWSESRQERFDGFLARLTASANLPHRWIENPEWVGLVTEFIPGAQLCSRQKLADTLIPRELERLGAITRKDVKDSKGTFQLDGWTGTNFHHYLGFMLTAKGKVELI